MTFLSVHKPISHFCVKSYSDTPSNSINTATNKIQRAKANIDYQIVFTSVICFQTLL